MVFGQRAEAESSKMVNLIRSKGSEFHAGENERAQALKQRVFGKFRKQWRDQCGWSKGREGGSGGISGASSCYVT